MKIDEASEVSPVLERASNTAVIEGFSKTEPSPEVIPSSNIVPGEHVESPQSTKEHVLSRPTSHAAEFLELCEGYLVGECCNGFQIEASARNGCCEIEDGSPLLSTEPELT